jgi:hypothetical protein
MPQFVPTNRPRMGFGELAPKIEYAGLNIAENPLMVVGIRGYYKNSMGLPGQNDSGIYDDAIFLITANHFSSYNANTEPSTRKAGSGFGARKGRARLLPGVWKCYRFSQHAGPSTPPYDAICQRAGEVTVLRDGNPDYPHTGNFGINIHRGGRNSTSSLGCQTIYPDQWLAFIMSAQDQAQRCFGTSWRSTTIPYVLLVNDWD